MAANCSGYLPMLYGKGRLRAKLIFVNYSRTDLYYLYFEWFYLGTAVTRGKR